MRRRENWKKESPYITRIVGIWKEKTVSISWRRTESRSICRHNFVYKNFVSLDLIRTFPINRWTKFRGKTRACRVQTDRFSRGWKNRSEMISDNVKRDQRHVRDESVTGVCSLHRLGKVAPIRRYVTTNSRNWSNYKAQRAVVRQCNRHTRDREKCYGWNKKRKRKREREWEELIGEKGNEGEK